MGLEYLYKEGVKACSTEPLKVKHDGRHVGEIRKVKDGYQYFPKDSKTDGVIFTTVSAVQDNLQLSQPTKNDREPADNSLLDEREIVKRNEKLNDEIDKIKTDAKEVNEKLARAKILLIATFDLLDLQKDSKDALNLLEESVAYDNADCDGHSLYDDIQRLINALE